MQYIGNVAWYLISVQAKHILSRDNMVCIQYKNRDTEKIVFSLKVKLKCPTNQV